MHRTLRQIVMYSWLTLVVTTCYASDTVNYAEAKRVFREYMRIAADDYLTFMAENGARVPEDREKTIEGLSNDTANCVIDALAAAEDSDADLLVTMFARRAPELEMGELLESSTQLSQTYGVAYKECFFSAALNNGMIIE